MSLLTIEHLDTGYGKRQVLFNVDFVLEEGELIAVVGSNGSGKSTLLRSIYRLNKPWSDRVRILYDGRDLLKSESHELIGNGIMYVPQKNCLFESLSVRRNLELSIIHSGSFKLSKSSIDEIVSHLPKIEEILESEAGRLSGGEQKLVSLAMILLNEPKVLLYDEPLAGLDGVGARWMLDNLLRLKSMGTSLIVVEHRLELLLPKCDRVIGFREGRMFNFMSNSVDEAKGFLL